MPSVNKSIMKLNKQKNNSKQKQGNPQRQHKVGDIKWKTPEKIMDMRDDQANQDNQENQERTERER